MDHCLQNETNLYRQRIEREVGQAISGTEFIEGPKKVGKVRDSYVLNEKVILITTDRVSAFDRVLASIPFKGQALNMTSVWWFERTKHIIPNHLLSSPDPNVSACKKCQVFPIEFVVRGFITGSTSTSMWTHYAKGTRNYCGIELPEGLRKNQRLEAPLVTPTTKSDVHDELISEQDILQNGIMTEKDWSICKAKALELFAFGQKIALEHGLLLVDTKYEFGKDSDGNILLIDEIHTPDSSRYWIAASFEERFARGEEPENIDKDILRKWYLQNCDPYKDEELPEAPRDLVVLLSLRYIELYERITGTKFQFPDETVDRKAAMLENLKQAGLLP